MYIILIIRENKIYCMQRRYHEFSSFLIIIIIS